MVTRCPDCTRRVAVRALSPAVMLCRTCGITFDVKLSLWRRMRRVAHFVGVHHVGDDVRGGR